MSSRCNHEGLAHENKQSRMVGKFIKKHGGMNDLPKKVRLSPEFVEVKVDANQDEEKPKDSTLFS